MTHAALDEIMKEVHRDLYYFTKCGSHRVMAEDHFAKLRRAIGDALAAERLAAIEECKKEAKKCRS